MLWAAALRGGLACSSRGLWAPSWIREGQLCSEHVGEGERLQQHTGKKIDLLRDLNTQVH